MSDLDWPDRFNRTPPEERTSYPGGFEVSRRRAIDDLLSDLESWGANEVRLETGAQHQKRNPNRPYARARPDDPGVIVYFSRQGNQYAIACDKWDNLRDNIRAIGKYVAHKRMLPKYGITTAEAEFETARLPPGNPDAEAIVTDPPSPPAHEVLGVSEDAPVDVVRGAARALKARHHPDRGGDREQFKRVVDAEQQLLEEEAR